ncbi:response regulator [Dyadobacter psychrotolerans]|uniref:Response regulator n=1 Tax=Dyadobacter psychrotolerans TaxID=2541721 RepID=A0A4R5DW52_9BACT|nr:response regulator [Dyadobacter psychrotolerans]TDE15253.1 response regulator [Dyadobacter psychrotolerans]
MTVDKKVKSTIFLVDDDAEDRIFLREAFLAITEDLRIIEFSSGEEFLDFVPQLIPQLPPSLVVMDMNMPRMNGLETLISLKSIPTCGQLPVVIFSTASNQVHIQKTYAHGASVCLKKPCSFEEYLKIAGDLIVDFL